MRGSFRGSPSRAAVQRVIDRLHGLALGDWDIARDGGGDGGDGDDGGDGGDGGDNGGDGGAMTQLHSQIASGEE